MKGLLYAGGGSQEARLRRAGVRRRGFAALESGGGWFAALEPGGRGFAARESRGAASPRWSQEVRLRRAGARRCGFAALESGGAASPRWRQWTRRSGRRAGAADQEDAAVAVE